MRIREIAALVQQRPQQADREQRVALRALHEPVHQRAGGGARSPPRPAHSRRGAPAAATSTRDRARPGRARTAPGRRRRDQPARRVGSSRARAAGRRQVAREIAQRLPRRRIREVHVVEHDHERPAARDVAEQTGEAHAAGGEAEGSRSGTEPRTSATRWNRLARSSSSPPHSSTTSLVRERAQERVHRLGPQPERRARRQRIRLGGESGHLPMARHQLAAEPTLADPGIAQQQDEPELTGPRAAELVLERRELFAPPDELRARTPRLRAANTMGPTESRPPPEQIKPQFWPAPDLSTARSAR